MPFRGTAGFCCSGSGRIVEANARYRKVELQSESKLRFHHPWPRDNLI